MKHPSVFVPQRPHAPLNSSRDVTSSQNATAALARQQIDNLYAADPNHQMDVPSPVVQTPQPSDTPVQTTQPTVVAPPSATSSPAIERYNKIQQQAPDPAADPNNPYEKTHEDVSNKTATPDWQSYHSAWQNYYQQYFHRYYAGHLQQTETALAEQSKRAEQLEAEASELTPDEALIDLRSRLRKNVSDRAKTVRKSRHFVPIMAGVIVMLIFGFLQYNRVLFANVEAYVSPGSIEPSNIIVDPNATLAVDPEPRLIIPKINVDVPVIWDAKPDNDSQMAAMEKGVAWFGIKGANAHPGEVGNTVLSGHSSNDWIDTGQYKFIFVRLEQMNEGDTVYVNYNSTRYTYKITKKQVVAPTDVAALQVQTTKPLLTLITCVPIGTANSRLLVTAEQINPDPAEAAPAKATSSTSASTNMPGNSPTFIERLFGGR